MVDFENDLVFNLQCLQKRSARKRFRRRILDEWPSCAYCGRPNPTTLDHVTPRAKGGKTKKNNEVKSYLSQKDRTLLNSAIIELEDIKQILS